MSCAVAFNFIRLQMKAIVFELPFFVLKHIYVLCDTISTLALIWSSINYALTCPTTLVYAS